MGVYRTNLIYSRLLQADLCTDDVMLLDAWDTIFIWIGAGANKTEKENAEKVAIVSKIYQCARRCPKPRINRSLHIGPQVFLGPG